MNEIDPVAQEVNSAGVPNFADDVLANSHATFKTLRDLGDVVWLSALGIYVVSRYKDVQAAAKASEVLISGQGVSVNEQLNGSNQTTTSTLNTDGESHHHYKRVLMRPLTPLAMQALRGRVDSEAAAIVDQLSDGSEFEGIAKLASYLPTKIVADLVGIKDVHAEQMLQWSGAVFDAFGPPDRARTVSAIPAIQEFVRYGLNLTRDGFVPGGWADSMLTAADGGELPMDVARNLVFDYVLPSLDTTIYSTGELLYQLATVPGAFDTLRARPELIPGVINEAVRLASPLRGFTRYVSRDFKLSETTLPAGSRVLLLFASANRDERHYPQPDCFDVERNPRDHLGWGHGVHMCAGMHLARLEMEALLRAILQRVQAIEVGTPVRLINNAAHGYAKLPMKLYRAN
jgi:cytochrome P450